MDIEAKDVLLFKALVEEELYALGEPPISLAEALIGFQRSARALAMSTKERRESRGGPKGFSAMPAPKLRVV